MVKKLLKDITKLAIGIVSLAFVTIRSNLFKNLDIVFDKAFLKGTQEVKDDNVKKTVVKNRTNALKKIMLQDIDKIETDITRNVSRTIATGYAQGLPSTRLKTLVKKDIDLIDKKVNTAVRYNVTTMSVLTKILQWENIGIKKYKWVLGVNDARTRERHIELHDKEFNIKDALEGRSPIPGRILKSDGSVNLSQSLNCRCSIKPVLDIKSKK